jgi:hypothetical protein
MAADFTREDLRDALEKKLEQWQQPKGGKSNNE